MNNIIDDITGLWSSFNPVTGYTSGYLSELDTLFFQTSTNVVKMRGQIESLMLRLPEIKEPPLRTTAEAVLTAIKTQLEMVRASGAGPSGTGMSGVYAAADGIFYIVLKKDFGASFVGPYLDVVKEMVVFETTKWKGQDFDILVRKECLNTVGYMQGVLNSLETKRSDLTAKINAIREVLKDYYNLFFVKGLDSQDFNVYWKLFQKWDATYGPQITKGYPGSLKNYYQINDSEEDIFTTANGWLELDLPVTLDIANRIKCLPFMGDEETLQEIWDAVSKKYSVDFNVELMTKVFNACNAYGQKYIIASTPEDKVDFQPTPDYLVNLVTGGEDFAVNYLDPKTAYSQLYLTSTKNTSLLTMINILVHEASHGFNFVMSAKNATQLLNLNTSLEVPMTEGMAFYREYQYWAAAQTLLYKTNLNEAEQNYLNLYGSTREEQVEAVLCAQLETYIWRVIRYIRALCDVQVNGGKMTYTEFIHWASNVTGLSEEKLHGECFTFLASPGYAPCYAFGGAIYAMNQKEGLQNNVPEIDFNTYCSEQGFYAWPVAVELMENYVKSPKVPSYA